MLSFSELKTGTVLNISNEPHQIVWSNFQRTAQRKPVLQTKLKNLISGKVIEYSFKFGEKVEAANLTRSQVQFLYFKGRDGYFMDMANFETINLPTEQLADTRDFLKTGIICTLLVFNSKPIKIELPVKVDYKITSTAPGIKGDTASGATKVAVIETGASLQVPLFINEGDSVIVNTQTGEYAERAV